jgi:threonine/homoserine efflux transporter RhtA
MRSALTALLLLVALAVDARTLAFYLVLAAIPAGAAAALEFYGAHLDGSADPGTGALHVGLASLSLLLCLVAASARAQGGDALGVSAVVGALLLLGMQLSLLLAAYATRERILGALGLR